MRLALFTGCQAPSLAPQYEKSTRLVLKRLGVELGQVEFNCCGYPMRHQHFHSFLLASARNLALAEAKGMDIVTLCKCCLGSLKQAQSLLDTRPDMRREVNDELSREGLTFQGRTKVRHLQSVLHEEIGLERISDALKRKLRGVRVAPFYGCHALRPSKVTGFDANPYNPTVIEDLLEVIGATAVPWAGRLKCCGAPLRERNEELSLEIISQRLQECFESGADVLNVDCPHTLMQVKWAFNKLKPQSANLLRGVVLYPQLLGLAFAISPHDLGLDDNRPRSGYLANFLSPCLAIEQQAMAESKPV
jgi:heterodisulfide reductase subunit B